MFELRTCTFTYLTFTDFYFVLFSLQKKTVFILIYMRTPTRKSSARRTNTITPEMAAFILAALKKTSTRQPVPVRTSIRKRSVKSSKPVKRRTKSLMSFYR